MPSPRGTKVIPVTVSQEEIVDPLLETHEKSSTSPQKTTRAGRRSTRRVGMNVIVAGTPRMRSTNYEGDTQSQRRTTPEEGTPEAAPPRGKQEPLIVNGTRSCP